MNGAIVLLMGSIFFPPFSARHLTYPDVFVLATFTGSFKVHAAVPFVDLTFGQTVGAVNNIE